MAEDSPKRRSSRTEDDDDSSPTDPGAADLQPTIDTSGVADESGGFEGTHTAGGDSRKPTEHIGPYRLIRELGKGGMGTVYLASRADAEFHNQVALKVVTSGTDRAEVISRFGRERRILSSLQHPNIARLLDAGASDDGRPYIVMDYVRGVPLHEHCDRKKLSTTARLRLFRQVCDAVQYAHRNLIVHRDLKPKNVLVTPEGVPKLLDFGIAKLLNAEVWGESSQTGTGLGPLTPEFASPEQVRGESITTATDVYSLGVVLYVLLTGRLPYRLHSHQPLEVLKAVTEQEPERPSTAAAQLESDTAGHAETQRQAGGRTIQRLSVRLRGDLDTILLTALRKEPDHRYPSVEAFSEDVRRHLEGLPIKARKGTLAYRGSKFVRRHKAALIAAVAVFLALASLTTISVRERLRAESALTKVQTEAAKSKAVVGFLQDTLGSANPYEGGGREVTVMEALGRAVDAIGASFGDQPETKAALESTIGVTYRDLSRNDEAEPLLRSALEIRRRAHGAEHPDVAESLNDLALLLHETGDYEEAEQLYREALAIRRELFGDEHPDVAVTLNNLAVLLLARGDLDAAEPLHRKALAMRRELFGDEHAAVAESLNDLAALLWEKGDYEAAEQLSREALAIRRKLHDEEHPELAEALNNLAAVLGAKGNHEAAEPLYRESLAVWRKLLGEESLEVAIGLNNLAYVLEDLGNSEAAEPLYREALGIRRRLLGEEHPDVALSLHNLANLLGEKGDFEAAEPLHAEALGIFQESFGANDWRTANGRSGYGACLTKLGRFPEAAELLLAAHPVLQARLGAQHDRTQKTLRRLIELYEAWNKPEKAAEYRTVLEEAERETTPGEAGASEG